MLFSRSIMNYTESLFLNFSVFTLPVLKDNYIFILKSHTSSETLVIDPALAQPVIDFLQSKKWTLARVLNTHHHPDHTGGNFELKKYYKAPISAPKNDPILSDQKLDAYSKLSFANEQLQVIDAPGHTLGHILYYFKDSQVLFVGDCLFSLGCGKVFEGSPQQMTDSLNKIKQLPDNTQVFCAHEYSLANTRFALNVDPNNVNLQKKTIQIQNLRNQNKFTIPFSLKEEKESNPFLRCNTPEIKKYLNLNPSSSLEKSFASLRKLKDNF